MAHGEVRLNQGIKMKKTTIAGLISLLFTTPLLAAETSINANDVIVTASRTPQTKESVIADVTVITQEEIERAGQSTFIELLQKQPSIEIGSNGGAGTISSIFMRGTSSNQIVVLIDGVRVNSVTDSATYFGNISLSQVERIEILRGPASSLYGQDAVGGVIQVFTKKIEGQPRFNAAVGYGSYNTRTAEAGFGGTYKGLNYSFNASSKNTDGFSALKNQTDARADRDGYRNLSANGSISYNFNEKNQIGIRFFDSEGKVDYDASTTFNNVAKLRQSSITIFSKNQINDLWKSTLMLSKGIDKYNDAAYNDFYLHWDYTNNKSAQNQYSWQNDFNLPVGTLTALIDRLEQQLTTNDSSYLGAKNRNSNGLYLGYVVNVDEHSFQANVRSDDSSQYGNHITKGIGYGYALSNNWRVNTSYGTAFKAPTFMDLYYGGANNLNLKPERSENFEATLKYNSEDRNASVTAYHNKIKDLIVFDWNSWSPQNYNATIEGITITGSQSWNGFLLKASADIQSPRDTDNNKMLARRANRHGTLDISKALGGWLFDAELVGSSARYNDVDNTAKLAGYALMNFVADYKINSDWSVQGRVNNILDKDYTLASKGSIWGPGPSYNTPGANVFFSLRYSPSY